MSRYLYKKIQNISPESLNFQHSGLKLTTLGYDPMSADEKKPEVTPTATPTPKPTATLILAAIICSDSVFCKRNKKY